MAAQYPDAAPPPRRPMTSAAPHPVAARFPRVWVQAVGSALFGTALLVIVLNAVVYTWRNTNPMVASDAWYFLDAFVRKVVGGDLSIADFFAKRPGIDHAQPLNKLLLYLNVQIAGMDFTYEALAGLAFAVATLAGIFFIVRRELPEGHSGATVRLCLLAIAALFLSLSSTGLYTWSLVTMGYSLHLFAVLLAWFSWRSVQTGRWMALVATGFAVGMCADDSASIIVAACMGGVLYFGLRTGNYRAALATSGWLALSLLASRVLYAFIPLDAVGPAPEGPGLAANLQALLALLPEFDRWLLIPSASSIANHDQMLDFFPEHWKQWSLVIGALVLAAQAWFWLTIWRTRTSGIVFLAVVLMLLAYGYCAGILYGRVATFGSDYLYQERYVLFYVLMPIALLLLGIERLGSATRSRRPAKALLLAAACTAILIQVPISLNSWNKAQYLDNYYQVMANQMFALARTPAVLPRDCVPLLTVCGWPPDQRAELFHILEEHRLNLFSREFDDRHGLYEGDAK
jgi:hypothetical protein